MLPAELEPDLQLASFAHEVNNLLTTATGLAQLASRSEDPVSARVLLDRAINRLKDMSEFIESAVTRAAPGSMPSRTPETKCEAAAAIAEVVDGLRRLPGHASIRTDVKTMTLAVPFTTLRQVLLNLIANANRSIAALPEYERCFGTIRIVGRRVGVEGTLRVIDSGRGVDPAVAERLFSPWATFTTDLGAHAEHGSQGHGLGLWISRGLVERCGGTLEWEASERGATFVIRLPLADAVDRRSGLQRSA